MSKSDLHWDQLNADYERLNYDKLCISYAVDNYNDCVEAHRWTQYQTCEICRTYVRRDLLKCKKRV